MAIKYKLTLYSCSSDYTQEDTVVSHVFRSLDKCLQIYNKSEYLHKQIEILNHNYFINLIEMDHADTFINKEYYCDLLFYTDILKII